MWRIIMAEISYSRAIFFIYLLLTIGITFIEQKFEDGGRFYVAMLLFLTVQNWLSFRAKGKRGLYSHKLPLSVISLSGVRTGFFFVSAVMIVIFYKSMHLFLSIKGHANYPITGWKLIHYISIVLFLFSVYFIITDIVAPRLREHSNFELIKERSLQILILFALVLQVLGIVAFLTRAPNFVTKIFDVLYHKNPFDEVRNIQIFAIISLVAAAISSFTYAKRRNYLL
jgi:hypothetical protein